MVFRGRWRRLPTPLGSLGSPLLWIPSPPVFPGVLARFIEAWGNPVGGPKGPWRAREDLGFYGQPKEVPWGAWAGPIGPLQSLSNSKYDFSKLFFTPYSGA